MTAVKLKQIYKSPLDSSSTAVLHLHCYHPPADCGQGRRQSQWEWHSPGWEVRCDQGGSSTPLCPGLRCDEGWSQGWGRHGGQESADILGVWALQPAEQSAPCSPALPSIWAGGGNRWSYAVTLVYCHLWICRGALRNHFGGLVKNQLSRSYIA